MKSARGKEVKAKRPAALTHLSADDICRTAAAVQRQNRRGKRKSLIEKYIDSVVARSRADGSFELAVKYRTGRPPGFMTRMALAEEIDRTLSEAFR